jgi:hypothetical protein
MDWSVLLGGLLAGVVLFVWYGLAWMVLPHHKGDYRPCPNRDAIAAALASVQPIDAWYMLPCPEDFAQGLRDPQLQKRWEAGPNACLVVLKPGPCMRGGTFAVGFVLNALEGLGLAALTALSLAHTQALPGRLAVFLGAALFVGAGTYLMQHVYARYPRRFALTNMADKAVGYALVALLFTIVGPAA